MLRISLQFFAHKKGVGSTKNGRDSESKRLGVKKADGQAVVAAAGRTQKGQRLREIGKKSKKSVPLRALRRQTLFLLLVKRSRVLRRPVFFLPGAAAGFCRTAGAGRVCDSKSPLISEERKLLLRRSCGHRYVY